METTVSETKLLSEAESRAYSQGFERGRAMHRPDRGRNCGTCDFWQPADHDVVKPLPWLGTCRKAAPNGGKFAEVTNCDWCADYVAAPDCE